MEDQAPGEPGSYLAPTAEARAEVRDKGSRFLGILLVAGDERQAATQLERAKAEFPEATHHCWAYRLGSPPRERASDDGEPSGTAGMPISRILAGRGLSDALVIVVRWFGGTKLGKGGLARADAAAAREAIEAASLIERFPTVEITVEVPYDRLGAVKRLLRPPRVELESVAYEEAVRLVLRVAKSASGEVGVALADLGVVWNRR